MVTLSDQRPASPCWWRRCSRRTQHHSDGVVRVEQREKIAGSMRPSAARSPLPRRHAMAAAGCVTVRLSATTAATFPLRPASNGWRRCFSRRSRRRSRRAAPSSNRRIARVLATPDRQAARLQFLVAQAGGLREPVQQHRPVPLEAPFIGAPAERRRRVRTQSSHHRHTLVAIGSTIRIWTRRAASTSAVLTPARASSFSSLSVQPATMASTDRRSRAVRHPPAWRRPAGRADGKGSSRPR